MSDEEEGLVLTRLEKTEDEEELDDLSLKPKNRRVPSLHLGGNGTSNDEETVDLQPAPGDSGAGFDEEGPEDEEEEDNIPEAYRPKSGVAAYIEENYGPIPFKEGIPVKQLPWILWKHLKENWRSGVTVSLVSLPLSISLAVAASATPNQGMITAAWAGLMSAIFGGSDYNVVGPTGALSGILSQYAIRYESSEVLSLLALLSALLLLIVYLFRLDKYMMFIPSSVIHGFSVGVALIIGLNQLAGGLGVTGLPKAREEFYLNIYEVLRHIDRVNPFSMILFIGTVVAMMMLLRRWPTIPWAIIISTLGVGLGFLIKKEYIPFPNGYRVLSLNDKFKDMKPELFTIAHLDPDWLTFTNLMAMIGPAFNIMFVAALETLISAKIASEMTHQPFYESWEVAGVTLANFFSGLFGGIPATAALARTSLNVKSGATSRASGIINGICIFGISYLLLSIFSYLLQPIVAGIVAVVAIRMIEVEPIMLMVKWDRGGLFVFIVTMLVCLLDNPTDGIIVGSVISLLRMAKWVSKLEGHDIISVDGVDIFVPIALYEGNPSETELKSPRASTGEDPHQVLLFTIPGDLTYLNAQTWLERAQNIKHKFSTIIISLRHLGYIDLDGVNALTEIVLTLEKKGSSPDDILVSGLKKSLHHYKLLKRTKWFRKKQKAGRVFPHYSVALDWLRSQGVEDKKHSQMKKRRFSS